MNPEDYIWAEKRGRDDEGDPYAHHLLIDGASRIYARVYEPQKGGYSFYANFEFAVEEVSPPREGVYFLELDQAKRFAERIVLEHAQRIEKAMQAAAHPEFQAAPVTVTSQS